MIRRLQALFFGGGRVRVMCTQTVFGVFSVNKNSHELFLHSWSFRMFGKLLTTSLESVPVRKSGRAFMVIGSRNSR